MVTIENSPSMRDEEWQRQWSESRYERLLDTIDEYLCEDGKDSGAAPLIRDLRRALAYTREWPQKQMIEIDKVMTAINDID